MLSLHIHRLHILLIFSHINGNVLICGFNKKTTFLSYSAHLNLISLFLFFTWNVSFLIYLEIRESRIIVSFTQSIFYRHITNQNKLQACLPKSNFLLTFLIIWYFILQRFAEGRNEIFPNLNFVTSHGVNRRNINEIVAPKEKSAFTDKKVYSWYFSYFRIG